MVEAMYEQSPEFFRKFQKSFKFCISNTLPEFLFSPTNKEVSYAYSKHSRDNTCTFKNGFIFDSQFHYHILIEIEKFSAEDRKSLTSKLFNVPCLFTCFKELISNVEDHVAVGPIMDKLTAAVLYNSHHSLETPCRRSKKKLPQVCVQWNCKRTQQTQTNLLPFVTINRITNFLYNSPPGEVLSRILDILQSGYGEFDFKIDDYRFQFSMDSTVTNFN